jgi:Uma2 family endonuclease
MAFAIISPDRIELPPGGVVRLPCSWTEYQTLATQRGDRSIPRIKYRNGEVLLMVPLPEQGKSADVSASVVRTLLDHQRQPYDAFTPITMTLPESGGIEPDYCFYITHWKQVQGMRRIDWQSSPPPDLVIEVDVTSYSAIADYLPYRVPEVWMLKEDALTIYQLVDGSYQAASESLYFPGFNLPTIVAECLQVAYTENTSAAIWQLQDWLKAQE